MRSLIPIVGLVVAFSSARTARAESWVDRCAEPQTAWLLGGNQPHVRTILHNRRHGSDQQSDAEVLRFGCPPGAAAWWWRPTPPAAVIDELSITLETALATTPISVAAEVILPRSRDPETGRPERLVVRPASSNSWRDSYPARGQRFEFSDLPAAVERAIRMRRLSSRQTNLDGRGAYVVGVGLVASGSSSPVTVEVAEVRLDGRVAPLRPTDSDDTLADRNQAPSRVAVGGETAPTHVQLDSTGWRIDGREFFVRARQVRGESHERLLALGFNTVWLETPPTKARLAGYGSVGLRVLCPCPDDPSELGDSVSVVLAWVLPGAKDESDLDSGLAEVERLRALPSESQRPVLAQVVGSHSAWSRLLDGVLIGPNGSRVAQSDRESTFKQYAAAVAPGTPLIATLPLEIDSNAQQQLDALLGDGVVSAWAPSYEIEDHVENALAASVCGVAFVSHQGLESPETAAEIVSEVLGLTNERLRLIEPWLTAPRPPAIEGARSVTLQRNGTRLTLGSASADLNAGRSAQGRGYLLTPAGIRPSANVADADSGAIDLLESSDPRVAQSLARYLSRRGRPAEKRLTRLAGLSASESVSLTPEAREKVESTLDATELAAARGDRFIAFLLARRALNEVQRAERRHVTIAQQPAGVHESSPLAILPTTLTEHFRLAQLIAASPRGPNRLQGGSFEELSELRRFGWSNESESGTEAPPRLSCCPVRRSTARGVCD